MFCQKCGTKINEGEKFCTQCGTPVETETQQKNTISNQPEKPKDVFDENTKGNRLCIISLILKYGVLAISTGIVELLYNFTNIISEDIGDFVISTLFVIIGICSLAAFVLMVVVRVKYPKNTFGKVLMWIYIIEIILAIMAIVILFLACIACVNSLNQIFSNCRGFY